VQWYTHRGWSVLRWRRMSERALAASASQQRRSRVAARRGRGGTRGVVVQPGTGGSVGEEGEEGERGGERGGGRRREGARRGTGLGEWTGTL